MKKAMLMPDVILRMLINSKHDEKVIFEQKDVKLVYSDFALYEALACVELGDKFCAENLYYLIKNGEYLPTGMFSEMDEERKEHLRSVVFDE